MARTELIQVRVTKDEKREIEEAAARDAADTAPWLRSLALREARRKPAIN